MPNVSRSEEQTLPHSFSWARCQASSGRRPIGASVPYEVSRHNQLLRGAQHCWEIVLAFVEKDSGRANRDRRSLPVLHGAAP